MLKSSGPDSHAAVIINGWGQIALDGAIVSGEYPALQIREISGGCICCGAGAGLERTVSEILDRVKPDRIFVEPSGVAKPGEIMDTLRAFEISGRVDAFFEKANPLYPPKLAVYATSFGKFPGSFLQAASPEMRSSMPEPRGERPPRFPRARGRRETEERIGNKPKR
jgi:hypothetical protein